MGKLKKKYCTVPIDLPIELWEVIDDITKLSGLNRNQMLRAILALELYKRGAVLEDTSLEEADAR